MVHLPRSFMVVIVRYIIVMRQMELLVIFQHQGREEYNLLRRSEILSEI